MNLIQDIRFFSEHPDPTPEKSHIRGMADIIQRLLFLLRWESFGFAEFDHLYLNYTPTLPHGQARLSDRPVDRYHPWLRYVDIGCDSRIFHAAEWDRQRQFLADSIRDAVHLHAEGENRSIFDRCYAQVMTLGAGLEIPYKEKYGEHLSVRISTTIGDDLQFHPIVRIFDKEAHLLLEQHLSPCLRDAFLAQFGSIYLGKRTVRIEPRKSQWLKAARTTPLKFSI